jgi:hypothetical protein
VLDVGSNTVHLLVVDARRGGHPTPMSSTKASLRLAEAIDGSGKLTRRGADKLISTIDELAKIAASSGCSELMAFATSAVRDATNSEDVLARVLGETGVALQVLSGVDESRLTFLAVRRWYRWSAGRIINIDIGGGSLELSNGVDEGGGAVAPAGRAPAHPPMAARPSARPPPRGHAARLAGHRGGGRRSRDAQGRQPGPRGGDVEDVPLAGPADRSSAVGSGAAGQEDAHSYRSSATHSIHL